MPQYFIIVVIVIFIVIIIFIIILSLFSVIWREHRLLLSEALIFRRANSCQIYKVSYSTVEQTS